MESNTELEVENECPTCKERREKFQAIGMLAFTLTVVTFGLVTPVTLPLAVYISYQTTRTCVGCRRRRAWMPNG